MLVPVGAGVDRVVGGGGAFLWGAGSLRGGGRVRRGIGRETPFGGLGPPGDSGTTGTRGTGTGPAGSLVVSELS